MKSLLYGKVINRNVRNWRKKNCWKFWIIL